GSGRRRAEALTGGLGLRRIDMDAARRRPNRDGLVSRHRVYARWQVRRRGDSGLRGLPAILVRQVVDREVLVVDDVVAKDYDYLVAAGKSGKASPVRDRLAFLVVGVRCARIAIDPAAVAGSGTGALRYRAALRSSNAT